MSGVAPVSVVSIQGASDSHIDPRVIRRVTTAAQVSSLIAFGISSVIVILYTFDLPFRVGFRLGPTLLAFITSASFFTLSRVTKQSRKLVLSIRGAGVLVTLYSLATVLEYLTNREFSIDLPYLPMPGEQHIMVLGRMPPNSAFVFMLIGFAIILQTYHDRFILLAQACSLLAGLIAAIAVMGYAYGVGHLYSFAGLTAMSFPGSLSFVCLAFAAFAAQPREGMMRFITSSRAGGVMARRLLLADLAIPPLLGAIAVLGYNKELYDTPFGISLVVIMSMVTYVIFTTGLALRLESADAERIDAERNLSRSREELRSLSRHVQAAQEDERIRIAREIHDELGQSLTALKMDVSLLRKAAPATDRKGEKWQSVLSLVDTTIRSVQRISTELRPGVLDDLGLTAAIEWQAQEFQRRTGIECQLVVTPQEVLADQLRSTALFRIVQETLTNVARHSGAKHVSIHLSRKGSLIILRISDDGKGISEQALQRSESLGLVGMRERAHLLSGTLEIAGIPGSGTTIEVRLPIEKPESVGR